MELEDIYLNWQNFGTRGIFRSIFIIELVTDGISWISGKSLLE